MTQDEIEQAASAYALLPVGWKWLARPNIQGRWVLILEGAPDTYAWQRLPADPQLGDIAGAAERCMCTLGERAAQPQTAAVLAAWYQ